MHKCAKCGMPTEGIVLVSGKIGDIQVCPGCGLTEALCTCTKEKSG